MSGVPYDHFLAIEEKDRIAEAAHQYRGMLSDDEIKAVLENYSPTFADNWGGGREAGGIRLGMALSNRGTPGLLVRNPLTGRTILYVVGTKTKAPFELVVTQPNGGLR